MAYKPEPLPPRLALITMQLIAEHAEKYAQHVVQLRFLPDAPSGHVILGLAAKDSEYGDHDRWLLHFHFTPLRQDGHYRCELHAYTSPRNGDISSWKSLFNGIVS